MRRFAKAHWPLLVIGALALAATGYLLALALAGRDLVDLDGLTATLDTVADSRDALPAALAAFALTLLALGLWARDRMRAGHADAAAAERDRAAEQADAAAAERDRAADELSRIRQEIAKLKEARKREREWVDRMRERIQRLQAEQGPLAAEENLEELVLRMTIELVEAEKGLLISGGDEQERRLVAATGWEADPRESDLAKRFASEVIERDRIVRERSADLDGERENPADAEIENLIAIPIYIADGFSGVVVCANSADIERHDDEVLVALGNQAGAVLNNSELRGELRGAYVATVRMLAEAIRAKDPHLGGHSHEVSAYVGRVASRLGLDSNRREELIFASLLHDVGKIGISERILLKPGKLTPEEFTVVKLHPRIGSRLVEQVPALSPLAQFILHHHERFDGSGYPSGLRGEQIPLEARVIGVADAFSAMTSDRPYQGRLSLEEACAELERNAGTQFDPEIVRLFTEEVRRDPPAGEEPNPVAVALDDPELAGARPEDGGPLGERTHELTDHLTLLYGHRYLHEAAAAAAQRALLQERPFGIALFELAEIAQVNDELGYAAGDQAIKDVARAVEDAAVVCGGTASRYGGRRIALLAPNADAAELAPLIERVLAAAPDRCGLRAASAIWQRGESGEDVVRRALAGLRA